MRFNKHSNLEGLHAFLSPSNYHWVNYDDDKLNGAVFAHMTARRGTQLHELARKMIELGVKLPEARQTLNMYVNDCIGFKMTPEQTLYYSPNAFGHTDAISFRKEKLRIFDLKNGVNECKFMQLYVYAALFCLEYGYKPTEIEIELRIYQNDEVRIEVGDPVSVSSIMSKIVYADRRINEIKGEVYG
jgi:hypothetical protein